MTIGTQARVMHSSVIAHVNLPVEVNEVNAARLEQFGVYPTIDCIMPDGQTFLQHMKQMRVSCGVSERYIEDSWALTYDTNWARLMGYIESNMTTTTISPLSKFYLEGRSTAADLPIARKTYQLSDPMFLKSGMVQPGSPNKDEAMVIVLRNGMTFTTRLPLYAWAGQSYRLTHQHVERHTLERVEETGIAQVADLQMDMTWDTEGKNIDVTTRHFSFDPLLGQQVIQGIETDNRDFDIVAFTPATIEYFKPHTQMGALRLYQNWVINEDDYWEEARNLRCASYSSPREHGMSVSMWMQLLLNMVIFKDYGSYENILDMKINPKLEPSSKMTKEEGSKFYEHFLHRHLKYQPTGHLYWDSDLAKPIKEFMRISQLIKIQNEEYKKRGNIHIMKPEEKLKMLAECGILPHMLL